jgi:hypothetical protein
MTINVSILSAGSYLELLLLLLLTITQLLKQAKGLGGTQVPVSV